MIHQIKSMGYRPLRARKIKTPDTNDQMVLANTLVKERDVVVPPAIDTTSNRNPKMVVGIHIPKIPNAINGIPKMAIHRNRINGWTCSGLVSCNKNSIRNSLPKLIPPSSDWFWKQSSSFQLSLLIKLLLLSLEMVTGPISFPIKFYAEKVCVLDYLIYVTFNILFVS